MKPLLLIVDDDDEIRTQLKWALNPDYDIVFADSRAAALEKFKKRPPEATLLDLGLPPHPNDPVEGFATLSDILACDAESKVIVVSGQGEKENALKAVELGAYDFLCKPADLEELRLVLAAMPLSRGARGGEPAIAGEAAGRRI